MKKQDTLTILSAFLVGIIAGSYLYIMGFLPQMERMEAVVPSFERIEEVLSVVGEMYGGMRAGTPPSFVLHADGTYTYRAMSSDRTVDGTEVEGELPELLLSELREVLTPRTLEQRAVEVTPETCAMFVDGVEYRYRVERDGQSYVLDTCGTDFSADSEAGLLLAKLWLAMERGTGSAIYDESSE